MKRVSLSAITAFLLTVIIFIGGFFAGEIFSGYKYNSLIKEFYDEELNLMGYQTQLSFLLNSKTCDRILLEEISKAKSEMGREIEKLEVVRGKSNEEVKLLKERYMLYVFLNYIAFKNYKQNCNTTDTLILFFYSNEPQYVGVSEDQGFVLDYIYRKYKPKVHIFAIDMSIENPLIEGLKNTYGVETIPTLIINDEFKLEGLTPSEKIEVFIS